MQQVDHLPVGRPDLAENLWNGVPSAPMSIGISEIVTKKLKLCPQTRFCNPNASFQL